MNNYTRSDIEFLLNRIQDNIDYFEAAQIENREYTIYLANGDKIKYSIPKKSIAHLLGVDTNYLMSANIYNSKDSYGILKEMCNNEFFFWGKISNGVIDPNKVFSKHVDVKIKNFKENIKINVYSTEFVCAYNKERTYGLESSEENYDYLIFQKGTNDKYMILGLANNGYYTVPMSNQIFDSFEDAKSSIKNFIYNQNITFINHIFISNNAIEYNDKIYVTNDIKLKKLNTLYYYKTNFNSTIDVSEEYKFILKKLQSNVENMQDYFQAGDLIAKCIFEGKIINEEDVKVSCFQELPDCLVKIIDSFNNYLISGKKSNYQDSYLDKIRKLNEAKKIIENLTMENKELDEKNNELIDQNNILFNENKILNDNNQKILESAETIVKLIKTK